MRFFVSLRAVAAACCVVPGLMPWCVAQSAHRPMSSKAAPAAATAAMTNADVIALASAGLDDEVLIAKIKAAPATNFDTSVDGLKALKAGGVSSPVIRCMIDPKAATPVAAAAVASAPAAPVVASPDDPQSAHTPGIYMMATAKDGMQHMVRLDHINPKQTKTSGAFLSGMTYGLTKAHVKVAIDGSKAAAETTDTNPVFYAYIPEESSFNGPAQNIRDFSLIRLDVKESTREVNTATMSPWGSSSGEDAKAKQGFTPEPVKAGVYKLALLKPLPPGQYAFQVQNYGAFFDFGVIAAQ